MPDKQSRELYLLERFLPELLAGRPYSLIQPAPPLPDIIVQVDGKSIGIELTDLIPDDKIRQREAAQDAILNQAQRLFEAQQDIPLHVTVNFNESANWKSVNRQQVAAYLAASIEQQVLEVAHLSTSQSQFDISVDQVTHSHVQGFSVFYLDHLTQSCWSPITSFWVAEISIQAVQKVIQRKSQKINGYLASCDEVWLLILETGAPSSYFDAFEKLASETFISNFSRTMIGRISKGEIIKLRTMPSA